MLESNIFPQHPSEHPLCPHPSFFWNCSACVVSFKLRTFHSWCVWVNSLMWLWSVLEMRLHCIVQFSTYVSLTLDRLRLLSGFHVPATVTVNWDYEQYVWHILQPKHKWAMSCINPCVYWWGIWIHPIMTDRFHFQQQSDIRLWSIFNSGEHWSFTHVSAHWYTRETFKTIKDLDRVSGIMHLIFIL